MMYNDVIAKDQTGQPDTAKKGIKAMGPFIFLTGKPSSKFILEKKIVQPFSFPKTQGGLWQLKVFKLTMSTQYEKN